MFFCPQLWPGIPSMKVCLPAGVLTGLCSSGTQGKKDQPEDGPQSPLSLLLIMFITGPTVGLYAVSVILSTPLGHMFAVLGVRVEKEVGGMEMAHEGMIWSLAWHPLGHILCSGSNDHTR